MAAIPNGDKNGKRSSVMEGFLSELGMTDLVSGVQLETHSSNLEDIYSEIHEKEEYSKIRLELDVRIRDYFSDFSIPDAPNIYDLVLLGLRSKDLVATFNWDPLLLQAYQRAARITKDLPELAFLHGNVLIGSCEEHKIVGYLHRSCPKCDSPLTPSRLLYPVKEKNYNSDPVISEFWAKVGNFLKRAYLVTVFGYSAPKTDVEAISLLSEAWGDLEKRRLEDFEFIDLKNEDDLVRTWKKFVHTHHYTVCRDFFESSIARSPRRTTEELFDRTMNCIFTDPELSFHPNISWDEIKSSVDKLKTEEDRVYSKGGYITIPGKSA